MGGKEHPQGPDRLAEGSLFLTEPVSQQSHQKLVGPGYTKGRGNALVPEPEKQEVGWRSEGWVALPTSAQLHPGTCAEVHTPYGCTHPGGPCTVLCSSTASVTWKSPVQVSSSG